MLQRVSEKIDNRQKYKNGRSNSGNNPKANGNRISDRSRNAKQKKNKGWNTTAND